MSKPIRFTNPYSGETLIHRPRTDGKIDLFVTRTGSQTHDHSVLNPNGVPSFIRENGRIKCDDSRRK